MHWSGRRSTSHDLEMATRFGEREMCQKWEELFCSIEGSQFV